MKKIVEEVKIYKESLESFINYWVKLRISGPAYSLALVPIPIKPSRQHNDLRR